MPRSLLFVLALTMAATCGEDAPDAGPDGGVDAGVDAGSDAGPPPVCEGIAELPEPPCGDGEFLYQEQSCGPWPPDAGPRPPCQMVGDGRCHQECEWDGDCTDPCRPFCRRLGLFSGGDYNCNRVIQICKADDANDC